VAPGYPIALLSTLVLVGFGLGVVSDCTSESTLSAKRRLDDDQGH
jgi:hypothetical protein